MSPFSKTDGQDQSLEAARARLASMERELAAAVAWQESHRLAQESAERELAGARAENERLRVPPELAEAAQEMLDEFENEKDPHIGTTMVWWGTMGAKTVLKALEFCAGRKP